MQIQKPYTNQAYAALAIYCNQNNCHIEDKGEYLESVANPPAPEPTQEEQRQKRAAVYQNTIDPITAHIQRLRDEEQTEEVVAKIQSLINERNEKVLAIQAAYPYPEPEVIDFESEQNKEVKNV